MTSAPARAAPPGYALGVRAAAAGLPAADLTAILGGNAATLFGLAAG